MAEDDTRENLDIEFSVRLSPTDYKKLTNLAEGTNRSRGNVIRFLLNLAYEQFVVKEVIRG
jgi:predicted transcriptional regulator